MVQTLSAIGRSVNFPPTLGSPRETAQGLLRDASPGGILDAPRLAARLAEIERTAPEHSLSLRREIDAQLTATERGELAAALDRGTGSRADAAVPSFAAIDPAAMALRPGDVTAQQLRQIMPNAGAQADWYAAPLNRAMEANGITTPERKAAFLAQISVESGDLRRTVENLNYSAQRLTEVWPSRFPTIASARPYANNPEALANRVYANRLGNGDAASGDGWNFRGRGLMQVTGRTNYRTVGFEDNPDALAQAGPASDTAAAFWSHNGLNAASDTVLDRAGFDAISRRVNGGDHGINERWTAYQRALTALGVER